MADRFFDALAFRASERWEITSLARIRGTCEGGNFGDVARAPGAVVVMGVQRQSQQVVVSGGTRRTAASRKKRAIHSHFGNTGKSGAGLLLDRADSMPDRKQEVPVPPRQSRPRSAGLCSGGSFFATVRAPFAGDDPIVGPRKCSRSAGFADFASELAPWIDVISHFGRQSPVYRLDMDDNDLCRWRLLSPTTGRRFVSRGLLSQVQALSRDPTAVPVPGTLVTRRSQGIAGAVVYWGRRGLVEPGK